MKEINHDQNLERRFLYNLLSDIFILKPNKIFLEEIHRDEFYDIIKTYSKPLGDIKVLKKRVKTLLENRERIDEISLTFENYFIIPVAQSYIPPLMSAFVDYTKLRTSNSFYTLGEELKAIYHLYDLNFQDRSDHISIIFSFMAYIINIDLSTTGNTTIAKQRNFFSKYIATWVEKFFDEVISRCEEEFYKIFASIGMKFISEERNLLG